MTSKYNSKIEFRQKKVSKKKIREQVKKSKELTEKDLPSSNIYDLFIDLSERWR